MYGDLADIQKYRRETRITAAQGQQHAAPVDSSHLVPSKVLTRCTVTYPGEITPTFRPLGVTNCSSPPKVTKDSHVTVRLGHVINTCDFPFNEGHVTLGTNHVTRNEQVTPYR
jgi:hypothetical protein